MDTNTLVLIVVAILAILLLLLFLSRRQGKGTIQAGPFGVSYEGPKPLDKPAEPPAAPPVAPVAPPAPAETPIEFEIVNVKAGQNITATNTAGGRTRADGLEAKKGSVTVTRSEGGSAPAQPAGGSAAAEADGSAGDPDPKA